MELPEGAKDKDDKDLIWIWRVLRVLGYLREEESFQSARLANGLQTTTPTAD